LTFSLCIPILAWFATLITRYASFVRTQKKPRQLVLI